jgi:hypothetical protein
MNVIHSSANTSSAIEKGEKLSNSIVGKDLIEED